MKLSDLLSYICVALWTIFTFFPLVPLFLAAFTGKLYWENIRFEDFTLKNFGEVISKAGYSYVNSALTGVAAAAIGTPVCFIGAYGLTRFSFRGERLLRNLLLVVFAFPLVSGFIPLYILFKTYGLINTLYSLIFVGVTLSAPLNTWMAISYLTTIPRELEESAFIDGCSRRQVMVHILLPLSAPILAVMSMVAFLYTWNELILAVIFLNTKENFTFPVALTAFGSGYQGGGFYWDFVAAGAVLGFVPVLIFYAFARKYLIEGLTKGAIKG